MNDKPDKPIPPDETALPPIPNIMRKIGVFQIDTKTMMKHWERLLSGLFSKVLVTRCEFIYRGAQSFWTYEACSDMFRRLKENEQAPIYILRWNDKTQEYDAMDVKTVMKLSQGPLGSKVLN